MSKQSPNRNHNKVRTWCFLWLIVSFGSSVVPQNIRDIIGRKLYEAPTIEGYQFREFFVQEVNFSDTLDKGLILIDKNEPVSLAQPNSLGNDEEYWCNTILKTVPK